MFKKLITQDERSEFTKEIDALHSKLASRSAEHAREVAALKHGHELEVAKLEAKLDRIREEAKREVARAEDEVTRNLSESKEYQKLRESTEQAKIASATARAEAEALTKANQQLGLIIEELKEYNHIVLEKFLDRVPNINIDGALAVTSDPGNVETRVNVGGSIS